MTHRPSIWCSMHIYFIIFYRLRALKTLYFYKFIKKRKINWNDFCKQFCKKSWKCLENQTLGWQVICIPANQQTSVLYCGLTDCKKRWTYKPKFGGDQPLCLQWFQRPFAPLHAAPFFMYIFFSPSSSLMCSKVPSSSNTRVHFPIKLVGLWQTVVKL